MKEQFLSWECYETSDHAEEHILDVKDCKNCTGQNNKMWS